MSEQEKKIRSNQKMLSKVKQRTKGERKKETNQNQNSVSRLNHTLIIPAFFIQQICIKHLIYHIIRCPNKIEDPYFIIKLTF